MNSFSWSQSYLYGLHFYSLCIQSTQNLIDLFSIIQCTLFDFIHSMVFLFHKSFAACAYESFIIYSTANAISIYRRFFTLLAQFELNCARTKLFMHKHIVFFLKKKSTSRLRWLVLFFFSAIQFDNFEPWTHNF